MLVTDALHLTVRFEDGEDGWILAFIDQVSGAMSQGRTREEARDNAIDALRALTGYVARQRSCPRVGRSASRVVKRLTLERHLREHDLTLLGEDSRDSRWGGPRRADRRPYIRRAHVVQKAFTLSYLHRPSAQTNAARIVLATSMPRRVSPNLAASCHTCPLCK